ncbi:MAG TPA: HAMP domain-containing sensor histidine kinase [Polyangiaceae bacterium]|nr:HAMP domain-containing sensor histidine kinase [Polyangiaceae bacterium]
MNSPLTLTTSHPRSPLVLRDARLDDAGNETDSGVFKLFESAILVISSAPDELRPAFSELERAGFSLIVVSHPKQVEELAFLPRFALIETALPGALELLGRINTPDPVMQVLALLGPAEAEGPALGAGAALTLRGPLDVVTLVLCMRRFRAQDELARQPRHVFDQQDRGSVPATVLESVLATIGHEIQNPLAAALASVECLREPELARLGEDERLAAVDDVAIALRRIRDVMGAVTSLVRGTSPDLSRLSLWECAERAVDALRSPNVRIEIAGDEQVRGFANGALLEQALVNLVQNAIDATAACANPQILVRVYRAGLEARISIRDNGPGVPLEFRQRIFEPFFTTKGERGTGLGLVLVHHAVGRMGGAVTLGPSRAGAVFRVRLRAA